VFENRVLRRIFGPKRDEVTGEWRKLHNEELHNLYSSPDIIRQVKSRRMRWAGHVAHMVEERKVYYVVVEKPEEKRPLGRPRRWWEDWIRMDLRETGWRDVDWIRLAQYRDRWRAVMSAVMNLRVLAPRSYSPLYLTSARIHYVRSSVTTDSLKHSAENRRGSSDYKGSRRHVLPLGCSFI
jgi:hypothetical protein